MILPSYNSTIKTRNQKKGFQDLLGKAASEKDMEEKKKGVNGTG